MKPRTTGTALVLVPKVPDDTVSRLTVYPPRYNPSMPDQVWAALQDMGITATEHLGRLVHDKKFPKLPVKEQLAVINTIMNRTYGSPDAAVRRGAHDPEPDMNDAAYNALRAIANRANVRLPEFRDPASRPVGRRSKDYESGD